MEKDVPLAEEEAPPEYQPPSTVTPKELSRQFLVTNGMISDGLKVFVSEEALQSYRTVKDMPYDDDLFERVKMKQNQGKGMPLIRVKESWGIKSYISIYKCLSSPESGDRLYDEVDDVLIAKVAKNKYGSYTRYRLTTEEGEILMYRHHKHPITDILYGAKRFRYVEDNILAFGEGHFMYELFLLDEKQASLVDDLDEDQKVKSSNPLLGNFFKNFFSFKDFHNRNMYSFNQKRGFLRSTRIRTMIRGSDQDTACISLLVPSDALFETNASVENESFMLLCTGLVLKFHEDAKQARRKFLNQINSNLLF